MREVSMRPGKKMQGSAKMPAPDALLSSIGSNPKQD